MLVGQRTESVGAEVDEGLHVVFCESAGGCIEESVDRSWKNGCR